MLAQVTWGIRPVAWEEPMLFRNFYRCARCSLEWEDVWSAMWTTTARNAVRVTCHRTRAKTCRTTETTTPKLDGVAMHCWPVPAAPPPSGQGHAPGAAFA